MNTTELIKALEVLKSGGIIAFPTDTLYGIGCNPFDEQAIQKIYKLKRRAQNKPLILFIGKKSEVEKYAYIPPAGKLLVEKFWPGGLTILFPSKNKIPLIEYNSTISLRIPSAEPILELLHQYKKPIATTSANLEGTAPPINHQELNIKPDFIIPGNSGRIPSTIIDVSSSPPTILREGKIKFPQIYSILQTFFLDKAKTKNTLYHRR